MIDKPKLFIIAMVAMTVLALAFFASQAGPARSNIPIASNACNGAGCNASPFAATPSTAAAASAAVQTQPAVQSNPSAKVNSPSEPLQQVSADQLVVNPASFLGKRISLVAPVGALLPEKSMFTVTCSCGQTQIPVSYKGAFPAQGRRVAVQGTLRQDAAGQYYFDAQSWAYAN